MIAQAGPELGAHLSLTFVMLFAVLGIVTLIYLALRFDRWAPVVLIGCGLLLSFVGVQRQRFTAQEAEHKVQAQAAELDSFLAEFHKPRIELSVSDSSTKESEREEKEENVLVEPEQSSKRPAWVDQPATQVGNVYRRVIVSDPHETVEACFKTLQQNKLREALNERLDELAPNRYRPDLETLGLGPAVLWRDICQTHWVETLELGVGEMKRVYGLVEFNAAADRQLTKAYQDYERQFRVREVGGIAGIGLGSLALLFGLLKIDTWTKGYYTKRLFFGVPAVIIGFLFMLFAA